MNFIQKLLSGAAWPFKQLDQATSQLVAEKVEVGTQAALDTLPPIVRALLEGKPVTVTIQLKQNE